MGNGLEQSTVISTDRHPRQTVLADGAHERKHSWIEGFRRITTSGEFIPEIDGLRFIAIAVVVMRHVALMIYFYSGFGPPKEGILYFGNYGVELFFVISGFILSTPFAMHAFRETKPVRLKRYYLRRLTRLEPPYIAALCVMLFLKFVLRPADAKLKYFFLSAFYLHGIALGARSHISFVTWSLEVEIQFYLLMPLLACVYWIAGKALRRSVIVAAAMLAIWFQPIVFPSIASATPYPDSILNYIQFFLAGLLLADVYANEWRGAPPPLQRGAIRWGDVVWLIGWPIALLACVYQQYSDTELGALTRMMESIGAYRAAMGAITGQIFDTAARALIPAMFFVIYLSVFNSVWPRRLMRIPLITVIGGMCYSIYLLHNPVVLGVNRVLVSHLPHSYYGAIFLEALVAVPMTLIVCGAFFRLIERPCMRPDWPQRLAAWSGLVRSAPARQSRAS